MKVKALAAEITRVLIKGDSTSNPREFDGLQNRIVGAQLIAAGSTNGGDALSLLEARPADRSVAGPNKVLWMSKAMRRRITRRRAHDRRRLHHAHDSTTSAAQLIKYNDIPILVPYEDNGGTEPLAFDESARAAAGDVGTSIYCSRRRRRLRAGHPERHDGRARSRRAADAPVKRTRVEWLVVSAGRRARPRRGAPPPPPRASSATGQTPIAT
jgi:hypothetical protein